MTTAEQIVENLLGDEPPIDPKDALDGMQERDPDFGIPDVNDLDGFTQGYLEAMWFTEEDRIKEELDESGLGEEAKEEILNDQPIDQESMWSIIGDCKAFQRDNAELLEQAGDAEQNGRDFWFTRNGHGVGFWDRGYPGNIGTALSDASKVYGESFLYVGDDGKLHIS